MAPPSARLRRLLCHIPLEPNAVVAGGRDGPLKGVKVLDLTQFQNGPSATGRLADNGADVIKVEPPEGDGVRGLGVPGRAFDFFEGLNRGKRSISLDLKTPEAREVMKRLVQWADVLAENFRVGVLDRLGYSYDVVKEWNPKIIYAQNSGFGEQGEWSDRASYDGIAQAFTGVMTFMGGGPSHEPMPVEWAFSDEVGAVNFYASIMDALFARERTGKGQLITTSQTAATLHFQKQQMMTDIRRKKQRDDGARPGSVQSAGQLVIAAGDGKFFTVAMGKRDQFERFVKGVLGAPEILELPGGKKYPRLNGLSKDGVELKNAYKKIIETQPRDHWLDLCGVHSVPAAPNSSYSELGDPNTFQGRHLRANGYIKDVEHRDFKNYTVIAQPTKYHGTPNAEINGSWHAPDIGEHTLEVLKDLNFTEAEISSLNAAKGGAPPARGPFAEKPKRA